MIALDTNVIVRVITRDDPAQAARAAALMRKGSLRLSKTVLLETEWVLRYTYAYDAPSINRALTTLVGLENLSLEDATAVEAAIAWHARGMDFADALHLASAAPAPRFATFDRRLAKKAAGLEGAPEVELLP
jgi:predicted nucleic-acid-binding protein